MVLSMLLVCLLQFLCSLLPSRKMELAQILCLPQFPTLMFVPCFFTSFYFFQNIIVPPTIIIKIINAVGLFTIAPNSWFKVFNNESPVLCQLTDCVLTTGLFNKNKTIIAIAPPTRYCLFFSIKKLIQGQFFVFFYYYFIPKV